MNVNEVLANRALELLGKARGDYAALSPNNHVNFGQSTNDTFPTALHLATLNRIRLLPIVERLADVFDERGASFHDVLKAGRTHLVDAVPITLGQEFYGYAEALRRSTRFLRAASEELLNLAIGGSAVGTGLNVKRGYREAVVRKLGTMTGTTFSARHRILREAMQAGSRSARRRARSTWARAELVRVGDDLRLLASGPVTGFAESAFPRCNPARRSCPRR